MSPKTVTLKICCLLLASLVALPVSRAYADDRDAGHHDGDNRGGDAHGRDHDQDQDHGHDQDKDRDGHHLAFLAEPSAAGTAGTNLDRLPWLVLVNKHGMPIFNPLRDVGVAAFLDASCTVPAPGTLQASSYRTFADWGILIFNKLSETKAEKIYLKFSADDVQAACSSAVTIGAATPDHLVSVAGDGQSGAAGSVLPVAAQIQAVDRFGNAVGGLMISFSATSGGGSASPARIATGSDGSASAQLKLGSAAGTNTFVAASATRLTGSPATVTFAETATGSSGPTSLSLSGPSSQSAGTCSSAFAVSLGGASSASVAASSDTAVTLSGLGSARLFADASCSTAETSVTIAAGASQASFYLLDTRAETLSLQAASSGLTSSATVSDTVQAGAAAALGFAAQPSISGTAGQALAVQPAIRILDSYGNAVSGGSFGVTLSAAQDGACQTPATGTLQAAANPVSSSGGTAAFAGVGYTQAATFYLKASSGSLTAACSKAITLQAAAPSAIVVVQGANQSGAVGSQLAVAPQVQVTDAYGNAVSGAGLSFAASGGGAVSPATATSDANGLASASFTLGQAPGTETLTVSSNSSGVAWAPSSGPASTSLTETAVAGAPASLALSGASGAVAGACSSYTISLSDSFGNATTAASAVSVALSGQGHGEFFADAACTQALGSASIAAGSGTLTLYFGDTTAESVTLSADGSASGLGVSSQAVQISAAPASRLVFSAQPSGAAPAGTIFATQPVVTAQDAYGNTAASASGSVTIAAYSDAACSSAGGGTLGAGANPVSLSGGSAAFGGVSYNLAGVLYLGASSDGLSAACSSAIAITAAGADHLISVAGNGQSATVGQAVAIAPQVKVVDAFGNPVSGFGIAFSVTAGGGSASPAQASSDANGLASTSFTLGTSPGNNSLTAQAASGALAGSPSQITFGENATAAAPASVVLSGSASQSAGACSAAFSLALKDSYGNATTASAATSIGLGGGGAGAFYSDSGCTAAASSVTIASGSGAGTFYFKDTRAESLLLTASASALNGSTLPYTVTPAAASSLAVTSQPSSSGTAGSALGAQPSFSIRDAYGNLVNSATSAVTLAAYTDAACSSAASGTLSAASNPASASGGIASFSGVSYTAAGTIYLGAASSGLSSACTGAISIGAGAASQLAIVQGDGQTATAGSLLAVNPTVKATDSFGNVASGATVTFAVGAGNGSVSASSATTDSSGQASTQYTLGVAGANQLTASLASGASVTFNETATAKPATALRLTGPSSLTAGSCSQAYTVQLLDSTGAATVASSSTSIALSGAGNGSFYTDSGCGTAATAVAIASGSGTAAVYVSDRVAESLTLVAQSNGLGSSSASATVSAAAAAALAFTTQPPSTATSSNVLGTQPVVGAQDAYGNTALFSGSVTLAAYSDSKCTTAAAGTLGASANPVTASGNQAAFAGVNYTGVATIYLGASSNGLTAACSSSINVLTSMALAAGTAHTCALDNGDVKCWGLNNAGSLGNGNNTNATTPQQVVGLTSGGVALGAGGQHACASTANAVYCWGLNASGQLGNGTTTNSNVPVVVTGLGSGIIQLAAGDSHSCALVGGVVYCWGDNTYGQLGNGSNTSSSVPIAVQGLPGVVQSIAAASDSSCAVLTNGTAYCWGYNDYGQLGNDSTTNSNMPVQVQGLGAVTSIAPGLENTCALVSGSVYCWGHNSFGQLGDGTFTDSMTPQQVVGLTNVTKLLSGGQNFSCVSLSTGAVNCWGQNSRGQLGDNKASGLESAVPVQVVGLTSGFQVLHAGYIHACASDGTHIQCWGWNSSGQLGNGTTTASAVPVSVIGY